MHLVIGAAGFAGRHAVTALGDQVRVRTAEPDDDLTAAMEGVDVVHLVAERHSPFRRGGRRRRTPDPLLAAAADAAVAAGVRRLVLLSWTSSLGSPPDGRVSERTVGRPYHLHERLLARDEAWLLARSRPEVVVVRAATPFGPGEPVLTRLLRDLVDGRLSLPRGGRAERSFLAGPDLGRAMLAAGLRGQPGMAYLAAGCRGTWRGLLDQAASLLGVRHRAASVPYDVAYLAAAGHLAGVAGGAVSWPTPCLVDLLARGLIVEDGWSRRELSWEPEVRTFAEGLAELADAYPVAAPAAAGLPIAARPGTAGRA